MAPTTDFKNTEVIDWWLRLQELKSLLGAAMAGLSFSIDLPSPMNAGMEMKYPLPYLCKVSLIKTPKMILACWYRLLAKYDQWDNQKA